MLELKKISVGYGKTSVLNGVDAAFEKGTLTSIIGTNGCGKSTLLKAMLGILPLSGGEIVVDGTNLQSMSRSELAKRVAYLPQGKNTPDMTVEQMVLHGRFPHLSYPRRYKKADLDLARKAMQDVGIFHLAHKPLDTLSGGMRQNAYIAMALAQDTDYVLLDEPTTYLDVGHQIELMKLLRRLADRGKGILTVMHDLPLAFGFSDKIALISDERSIITKTPNEFSTSPIMEKTFGVQIKYVAEEQRYYLV